MLRQNSKNAHFPQWFGKTECICIQKNTGDVAVMFLNEITNKWHELQRCAW